MIYPRPIVIASISLVSLAFIAGCSDSSNDTASTAPVFEADTSYLDDLAQDQEQEDIESIDEPADPEPISNPQVDDEKQYADEDRDWTAEEGSKSIFGRARDKAKKLSTEIQDSTQPSNGIAITYSDEEYAQAAGFAWDMNEDWQMAVPASGRFAEMYIQNQLGNASIAFTKETNSPTQIRRSLESSITDTFTGRSKARTSTKTVKGFTVTTMDLSGTYIDPGAKGSSNGSPFYAIHAVVVELPTTKVLIKLWGPEDTVKQNIGKFDAMIEKMYEK